MARLGIARNGWAHIMHDFVNVLADDPDKRRALCGREFQPIRYTSPEECPPGRLCKVCYQIHVVKVLAQVRTLEPLAKGLKEK